VCIVSNLFINKQFKKSVKMKLKSSNIVFSVILCGLILCSACSGNKQDTHTHENGLACEEHATTEQTVSVQESFKVEADSNAVEANTVRHEHEHEHNHEHNHGDEHNHTH
jgi:hypothetical protein